LMGSVRMSTTGLITALMTPRMPAARIAISMDSILMPFIRDAAIISANRFMDQRRRKPIIAPPENLKNSNIVPAHLQLKVKKEALGSNHRSIMEKPFDFENLMC
jgi:hypothetical protein